MNPVVYLYDQQLQALDYPSGDEARVIKGQAYSKDDDTVFHVFAEAPDFNPSGTLTTAVFFVSRSDKLLSVTETHIEKQMAESDVPQTRLYIFLVKDRKDLNCKVFLEKGEELLRCETRMVPEQSALYSRSRGLLETDALAKKAVGIIGLGSGGSQVAVELAKAGIGKFVLIDYDQLELSNVARHICGVNDLGRMKTHAVQEAIQQKNPYATVETLEVDVTKEQEACDKALSNVDLIIAASDNDRSRFLINEMALKYKTTALFGRALTRAIGGDVLRVRPFEGPCYSCLYSQNVRAAGGDDEEVSQRKQAKKLFPGYTSEEDLQAAIQVGLASDIAPIANFMVKLALVELSKGLSTGISSLEEDFVADFYIWANRRENVYEHWNKLEYHFDKPSILRWYGAKVERDEGCMVCGESGF